MTVYTSDVCPACHLTTQHLDKLGIPFMEVRLTDHISATAAELGLRQAPIVCVTTHPLAGRTPVVCWSGYRPDRIDALVCVLGVDPAGAR